MPVRQAMNFFHARYRALGIYNLPDYTKYVYMSA